MGQEITEAAMERERQFARYAIETARNALMVEIATGLRYGLTLEEILDLLGLQGNATAKAMIRMVTKQTTPEQLADAIDDARRSWES